MPTGCHVRRRIYAAVHGPTTSAIRQPFPLHSPRDPFARLQSLRCFGTSVSCDSPVDFARDARPLEGSELHKTRLAVALSSRTGLNRPHQTDAVRTHSEPPAADIFDSAPEQADTDGNRQDVDSASSNEADQSSVAQTSSRNEAGASASGPSVMIPLPSFEDDGIQLHDLNHLRKKQEARHASWKQQKRQVERELRADSRFPVSWSSLFDLLRRYTPDRRQGSRTSAPEATLDPTVSSKTNLVISEHDVPNINQAAAGTPLGFTGLRDFINDRVPKSSPTQSGLHLPGLLEKIVHFLNTMTPSVFASVPLPVINESLRLLMEHSRLPDAVRILFRLRSFGLKPQASTLNVFLQYAAGQQHNNAMEKYLKMMIIAGFTPDAESWAALLSAAPTEDKKREALQEMNRRGLLADPKAQQAVIPLVMGQSLDAHLDAGKSIDEYIDILSSLCGSAWVSDIAVDRLLNGLMVRGCADDALRVLHSLKESYKFRPEAFQLNKLLSHHVRSQDLARAVRTCVRFDSLFGQAGTSSHCDQIFYLAWRLRYYNVAKVAWKYASKPTYEMRRRVLESINRAHDLAAPNSRLDIWKKKAGYVICDHHPTVSDRTAWHAGQVPDWMDGEIKLLRHVSLTEPFSRLLLQAWHVDQEWLRDNIRQAKDIPWMVEHSVHIPSVKRGLARDRKLPANTKERIAAHHAEKLAAIDKHELAEDREKAATRARRIELEMQAKTLARRWSKEKTPKRETHGIRQVSRDAGISLAQDALSQRSQAMRRRWGVRDPDVRRKAAVAEEEKKNNEENEEEKAKEAQEQGDWWDVGWNQANRRSS